MPFKKGKSGNVKGRPVGIKNKQPEELRTRIQMFVENKMNEFDELWKELKPKEKADLLMEMMKYMIPRLNAISTDINVISSQEKIIQLFPTDAEIEQTNQ